jgi:hypothetical protein
VRIRAFTIPYNVKLPGLLVKVNVVEPTHLCLQGSYGSWEYNSKGLAAIYINAKKPIRVQRLTLLHELQHVMVDYLDQALENHPAIFALGRSTKKKRKK